jgi:hypothetical protein
MRFPDNRRQSLKYSIFFAGTILLLLAFFFLHKSVQPAHANNTAVNTSTYMPMLIKYFPGINPFGVAFTRMNATNGLLLFESDETTWTRRDVYWKYIEPDEGDRIWSSTYEQELVNAHAANISPVLILEATPEWALKDGFICGAVAEDKLPALASFAYDLVKRYSAPPYYVRYWEMWNEPDAADFMGCWGDPSDTNYYGGYYYGQMLKAVYPAIKAADPQAQVLVGGLLLDCDPNNPPAGKTCVESKFLRGILENNAGNSFDGVSFHGYDYYYSLGAYGNSNWNSSSTTTGPVTIAKSHYLQALLEEYGQGHKYLNNTESAIFYGAYDPAIFCVVGAPPEVQITKAYYVVHSYAAAVAEGWKSNIWYSAFGVRCSGLIESDLDPLPAYYTYRFTEQELTNARFVRAITEYPGVKGYEYVASGRRLMVLWSLDGNPHTITLSQMPISITHIGDDGKPVVDPNSKTLTINLSPRFIKY